MAASPTFEPQIRSRVCLGRDRPAGRAKLGFCLFNESKAKMASRPLICPERGQTGYGAAPGLSPARNRNSLQRPAAVVFAVSSALVLLLVVMSGHRHNVDLAQVPLDKLDAAYLQAEASGKGGKEFLRKLQDMWFVAQYRSNLASVTTFDLSIEMILAQGNDSGRK